MSCARFRAKKVTQYFIALYSREHDFFPFFQVLAKMHFLSLWHAARHGNWVPRSNGEMAKKGFPYCCQVVKERLYECQLWFQLSYWLDFLDAYK